MASERDNLHAEVQTHIAVGNEFPNGELDPAEVCPVCTRIPPDPSCLTVGCPGKTIGGHLVQVPRDPAEAMRAKCEAIAHGFSLEANQGRNRLKVSETWRDDQTPSDVYNLGADDASTFIAADIAALKGNGEGK